MEALSPFIFQLPPTKNLLLEGILASLVQRLSVFPLLLLWFD